MKNHTIICCLFSTFLLTACDNEETIKSESSSVSVNGELSGVIEEYVSGDIDSIQVYGHSGLIFGTSNVSSTGNFSFELASPYIDHPMLIESYLLSEFEGNVSNKNASISYASLLCFKDGHIIGILNKCNFPVDQSSDNVGISSDGYSKGAIFGNVGSAYSEIIHCNVPVTIKGNAVDETSLPVMPGFYTDRMIFSYDFSFQPGWNEVVIKYSKYSTSIPAYVFNVEVSNVITRDLKWRFFRIENFYNSSCIKF